MTVGFVLSLVEGESETCRVHELRPDDLRAWLSPVLAADERAERVREIAIYLADEIIWFLNERDGLPTGPYPTHHTDHLQ